MAIKDDAAFAELKPYMRMTVAPNGVTIGDLNFVSAQSHWSAGLLPVQTAANTILADTAVDLFQVAQGDVGQGYTTALTRGQTSWLDSQGRLPANQVFIATRCAFQIAIRVAGGGVVTAATGFVGNEIPIRSVGAAYAIGQNFGWQCTVGDGITRPYGSLIDYAGNGAAWGVPIGTVGIAGAVGVAPTQDTVCMLGHPDSCGSRLPLPLVFPPNIGVRIRVLCGGAFALADVSAGDAIAVGECLMVKCWLNGYLCTMPVG